MPNQVGGVITEAIVVAGLHLSLAIATSSTRECAGGVYFSRDKVYVKREATIARIKS